MKIEVINGDITKLSVDAIVNAANSSLLGGGGVDGAIHNAGGLEMQLECIALNNNGGCSTGDAVITGAGKLDCEFVIHTVGPIWEGGNSNEPDLLANCYRNSLKIADENIVKSIAFPNISTGVYGYPKRKAAEIAIMTIRSYNSKVEELIFVCFDNENYQIYKELLDA